MKVFFRRIHLYLALAAGLVIMITCLTGAILVFEKELQHFFYKDRYYTEHAGNRLPLDQLVKQVKQQEPGAKISGVKTYTDDQSNVEISFSKASAGQEKGKTTVEVAAKKEKRPADGIRLVAFVDPYTGEVKDIYNHRESFFYFVMDVHRWMLGGDTGKLIVGICTLVFLFILITGIILWWPKTKNILKQRLNIKWGSGWKRLNHDFHIVLGFYSAIFLFIFAFTGLAWSFEWFNKGIYKVTGSSQEQPKAPVSTFDSTSQPLTFAAVHEFMQQTVPGVRFYNIAAPKDSTGSYNIIVLPETAVHESATDAYFVDRYTLTLLKTQKFGDRNLGQRVRSTFKPVHIASVFGLTSKLIGLVVCLLGVFFPVTGYIMWWQRTRRKAAKV